MLAARFASVKKLAFLSLLIALRASAHDFWLEPSTFRPAPQQTITVGLRVGQDIIGDPIPRSASLIGSFFVRDRRGDRPISGIENHDPAGFLRLSENGVALLGYVSKPYPLELTPDKYREFLRLEGFDSVQAPNTTHHEQFSRYAKAVVGTGTGAALDQPLGWRFEIIPQSNHLAAEPLRVRVLLDGKPLAGALLTAMNRDDPRARVAQRTSRSGTATLALRKSGVWLVKCVALVPAKPGSGLDAETLWASLTFER